MAIASYSMLVMKTVFHRFFADLPRRTMLVGEISELVALVGTENNATGSRCRSRIPYDLRCGPSALGARRKPSLKRLRNVHEPNVPRISDKWKPAYRNTLPALKASQSRPVNTRAMARSLAKWNSHDGEATRQSGLHV